VYRSSEALFSFVCLEGVFVIAGIFLLVVETTRNEGSTKKGLLLVIDEHPLFLLMMDLF
jgi:hypothetical protein